MLAPGSRSIFPALDAAARSRGCEPLGGVSNRVYVNSERSTVLKLAPRADDDARADALHSFQACQRASQVYAAEGLMPEVLDVGPDFEGTGCPYLKERYVPGRNLAEAYLLDPLFWEARLPGELIRLSTRLVAGPAREITEAWDQNLAWHDDLRASPHFSRFAALHVAVKEAGLFLRKTARVGHLIHGDLQFGNLLALEGERSGEVMLIDWQESDFWPLAFDYAMLYTFLMGPAGQVEEHLRPRYESRPPLTSLWCALAPKLHAELGIGPELREFVVFRMARGWLYKLDQALRTGQTEEAERYQRAITELIEGRVFQAWPLPGSR